MIDSNGFTMNASKLTAHQISALLTASQKQHCPAPSLIYVRRVPGILVTGYCLEYCVLSGSLLFTFAKMMYNYEPD